MEDSCFLLRLAWLQEVCILLELTLHSAVTQNVGRMETQPSLVVVVEGTCHLRDPAVTHTARALFRRGTTWGDRQEAGGRLRLAPHRQLVTPGMGRQSCCCHQWVGWHCPLHASQTLWRSSTSPSLLVAQALVLVSSSKCLGACILAAWVDGGVTAALV